MNRQNEHNLINKLVDLEKIIRSLVYNAILTLDFDGSDPVGGFDDYRLPPDKKLVIVGGKCFDIAYNKNFLEFFNHQHELNKTDPDKLMQMNQILKANNVSKFLTSADVDVHLLSQTPMTNINFNRLAESMGRHIERYIRTNNLDYFNSVVRSYNMKIVDVGGRFIKVVKPTVRKLEFIKLNRMYIEFEFINSSDQAILQQLEILDPSSLNNFRVLSNSRVRLYVFDIVFELEQQNIDAVLDCALPQFVLNRSIKLPGYNRFYTLSMYDMLVQIYGLIQSRANKLARNIVRFAMGIIFLRNHYLSPTGLNMAMKDFNKLNSLFIEMIRNRHLNKILNMSTFNILIKDGQINPAQIDPLIQIDPAQINPAQIDPAQINPAQIDPLIQIPYSNSLNKMITRYTTRPFRCANCNTKHYEDMIYGRYDTNFKCCPVNTRTFNRQYEYNHVLNNLPEEHITIFDYYGIQYPNGPAFPHNIYTLISNRKNQMMSDADINGQNNYNNLKDRFNQVNVIKYNSFYRYNVTEDDSDLVIKNIRLPRDLINVCSKTTIITYVPTFLFIENLLINEHLYQTYDSVEYDRLVPITSQAEIISRMHPSFNNQTINGILFRSTNYIGNYVGPDSGEYNNKCKDLFINNKNRNVRPITRDNIEDLQKRLIIGSRFNRSDYPKVHNCHNSFITYSGQYLPITRKYNSDRNIYSNSATIDDIGIGNELFFNTFNSTSCRLGQSYNWFSTDVCYIIRTNMNNTLNNNAIFSVIINPIQSEMEILFGFGNKFVVIDKFFPHSVRNHRLDNINLNDEPGTVDYQSPTQLFTQASAIYGHLNKEKKMQVIDTCGSYLNNNLSKIISSQSVSFQAFLNNYDPNIGVSKHMPVILYSNYNAGEDLAPIMAAVPVPNRIIVSCTNHKLISLIIKLTGNGNLTNPLPDTWAHYIRNDPRLTLNYLRRQMKLNKYYDANFVDIPYTNRMINNYVNLGNNENIVTLVLSEATRKKILYCFPQLLDFFYTKNITCENQLSLRNQANIVVHNNIDIYNSTMVFKHYGNISFDATFNVISDLYPVDVNVNEYTILTPNLQNYNLLLNTDIKLALYGLRYSLYVAYSLFGFAHGDIIQGRDYNLMMDIEKVDDQIEYVMFKTRIGDNIYRFIYKLSKPGYIPKIIIMDFGYSDLNYNGHQIEMKIAGDNQNIFRGSLIKFKGDLFTHIMPEPNTFCFNKLLSKSPFNVAPHLITKPDIVTSLDVRKLITSTMRTMPDGSILPPVVLDLNIKMSTDRFDLTDKTVFERLHDFDYDQTKVHIYSNVDATNNILINDANIIGIDFNQMINNIIQNKI